MEVLKICEESMLKSSLPDAVVDLSWYKCRKGCKTNSYSYRRADLVCPDSCSFNINDDCKNTNHYKLYKCDEEEND